MIGARNKPTRIISPCLRNWKGRYASGFVSIQRGMSVVLLSFFVFSPLSCIPHGILPLTSLSWNNLSCKHLPSSIVVTARRAALH